MFSLHKLRHERDLSAARLSNQDDFYEALASDLMQANREALAIQKPLARSTADAREPLRTHLHHMLASGDEKQEAKAVEELLSLYELNILGK